MSFVNKETVKVQIEAFRGAQGPVGPAGPQGVQGPAGADGRDYILTEADKQEIAGMVGTGGGSSVELDTTLTQSGKAADAKAVGDAIGDISTALDTLNGEVI